MPEQVVEEQVVEEQTKEEQTKVEQTKVEQVVEEQTKVEQTKVEPEKNSSTGVADNINTIFDVYMTYAVSDMKPTIRKSPFTYHRGMRYSCTKETFQKENIIELIHKGKISQTCSIILHALGVYSYLNAFMLRNIVYMEMGRKKMIERENFRVILKQLIERGLVVQYELFYKEDGKEQGSSFIYALSTGGDLYCDYLGIGITMRGRKKFKNLSISTMLSILAVNQFHISLMMHYQGKRIIARSNIYKKSYVSANVAGDYAVVLPDKRILNLYLTCIRNTRHWADDFIYTIGRLISYVNEIDCSMYLLLVICETEHQVLECECLKKCHGLNSVPILYTTDTTIAKNRDVFARMIRVTDAEKGEKEYLQFNF